MKAIVSWSDGTDGHEMGPVVEYEVDMSEFDLRTFVVIRRHEEVALADLLREKP